MSFFDSEIVQKEMEDITSLQEEIYDNVYSYFTMNKREKIEHIKLLKLLLTNKRFFMLVFLSRMIPEQNR